MSEPQGRIYYGGNEEEPYITTNSFGERTYVVPAGYPELVRLLQVQAAAYFWATAYQLEGLDDNVDLATVNEWRKNNPPLR